MTCSDGSMCEELLDHLWELVDAEAGSGWTAGGAERGDEGAQGHPTGPDARALDLLAAHAHGCPHCADALDAERHVRILLRRCCAEQDHAPESLRVRVISSTTTIRRD